MDRDHQIWRFWSESLHRWGLRDLTASLLEALGPFSYLGAQAVYLAQPALSPFVPGAQLQAAAHLLEDGDEVAAFVAFLREAS